MDLGEAFPLRRALLRAPLALYALGFGWVLGERFLQLTHRGRRTGLPRHAVLEVLRHDVVTDTYVVCAGWHTADWLRNVRADPHVAIVVGWRLLAAIAEPWPPDVGAQELRAYAARHPITYRVVSRRLLERVDDAKDANRWLRLAIRHPVVALHAAAWAPARAAATLAAPAAQRAGRVQAGWAARR